MALSLQPIGPMQSSRDSWCLGVAALGLVVAALGFVGACGYGAGGGEASFGYDYGSEGARLYAELCESCHGEAGEGGLGPALADSPRPRAELAAIIDERMPANDPARCDAACADAIAGFIGEGLSSAALSCERVRPSPRRLRLLTRREYEATVRDLFHGGACGAGACDCKTFVWVGDASKVHVAGTFNGWAGTVAAGGWPLARDPATGEWRGTFTVPPGAHTYKLVVDESQWLTDPLAAESEPDGLGGQNSKLEELRCASAGFPPETRPSGFFFDDAADAAVVTATHLDAYLAAAGEIADDVAARLDTLTDCAYLADPDGCADELVGVWGRRLFRRPLAAEERARYAELVRGEADFAAGFATALHAMLVSPYFLYRSELGVSVGGGRYRLTGHEVAAALSYGLWGTTPDETLLAAADAGELDDLDGIERHARRLLEDPRARAMVGELVAQWLGAENIVSVDKNAAQFPGFDDALRAALLEETRRFAAHVVFDGTGSFAELLTADYSLMSTTVAAHYGVAPGAGAGPAAFARTAHGDGRRAGLLGHASVLGVHAHSDQTSPIRRGLLVRRQFLCQELPPPPPDAGGVPEVDPDATTRERFAQHTSDPACAGCHTVIDPIGFGFERFDPVGRWRETDGGKPIDATADLVDVERLGLGTSAPFSSLPELGAHLAASRAAPACFVRQTYRFTRGFRETLAERCARLALEERFTAAGGDVRELLVGAFLVPDFLERR